MHRPEGVVDVDVCQGGELLGKALVVRFLLLVEPEVLEQAHLSRA
jgi:hypothetical protein